MDLYDLLPEIIRLRDLQTSDDGTPERSIVRRVIEALQAELDVLKGEIEAVSVLQDVDACPVAYLPLLAAVLGASFPATWPEGRIRLFLSSAVQLFHASGMRLSWEAMLRLLGHAGYYPWELWKEELYEDFDYALTEDYGNLPAARVDLRDADGTYMEPTAEVEKYLEQFRPIHVLIRKHGHRIELGEDAADVGSESFSAGAFGNWTDGVAGATDVCLTACEASCETFCEAGSCEGAFEVILTCIAGCETGCETTGDT